MSIKQGEYLKKLRREKGLSQDALSEILGISRQSISKWEQGNSSPDIENTEKLARYYGVSIDSIVKGEEDAAQEQSTGTASYASAAVPTEEASGEKKKRGWLYTAYPVITIIVYCILGVLFPPEGWYIGWTVLLTIPLYYTGVAAVEKKKPVIFCYPVLAVLIYVLLGLCAGLWHPSWIIFLTIPIYYIVTANIGKK